MRRLIWLSGMPRSGTTWVAQLLSAHPSVRLKYCPLFSYEFRDRCNVDSSRADWLGMLEEVYNTPGRFLDQEHLRGNGLIPRFPVRDAEPPVLAIKSNRFHNLSEAIIRNLPEIRWVALVRHPAATIHSWLTNPTEFPSGADPAVEWRSGACRKTSLGEYWGFNDWVEVTKGQVRLAAAYPDQVRLVRYDVLARYPHIALAHLFDFLGLDLHVQVSTFLADSQRSHSADPRSVFKTPGHAERWRQELSPVIQAEIERVSLEMGLGDFLHDAAAEELFYGR